MKQRLIDANEAENNLYGFTRYTGIDEAPYEHAEAVINKLPTVEAIPIKWIKKWVENSGNEPVDDFTDVDAYCDGYQKNVIECLLNSWEKENENNR